MPEETTKSSDHHAHQHSRSDNRHRGDCHLTTHAASASAPASAVTSRHSKSIDDARAKFAAGVARGVAVLMEECGYSRERAQTALLREIAGNDNSPPNDEEIFQTMSTHRLGIDDAVQALTVSKALRRDTANRSVSLLDAIDDLTSKLSITNLVRMSRGSSSPPPYSSSCDDMVAVPAKVRIHPVSPAERPVGHSRPKATTINSTSTITNSPVPGRKTKIVNNKSSKPKGVVGTRKRPVDEIKNVNITQSTSAKEETQSSLTTRARSDSLAEVVNAKFGDSDAKLQMKDEDASIRSSSGAVRAKRRLEDPNSSQHALKRPRATGDL